MLIQAKHNWQYHVAVKKPFPEREEDLGEAADILAKTISEYEANDGILEDGLFLFIIPMI